MRYGLFAFVCQDDLTGCRRVHVDGNAIHSRYSGRENVPAAFVLDECQKVCLSVYFELQFTNSPWVTPKNS
jgi:hypothetical protein